MNIVNQFTANCFAAITPPCNSTIENRLDDNLKNCRDLRDIINIARILKDHNIDVFVLSTHTSHVKQMFDVGVAATMKSCFSEEYRKIFKFFRSELNQAAQLRHFFVQAAIYSWQQNNHMEYLVFLLVI